MPVYYTKDSGLFQGQGQRCQLSTVVRQNLTITTADQIVWTVDSAEIGAVNASLTIKNTGSTTIRLTAFVCNDNGVLASAGGNVALTELFSEADASIPLALSITAGSVDHVILGYRNQPMLTTFRFWNFVLDTASGSSTADIFGNAH